MFEPPGKGPSASLISLVRTVRRNRFLIWQLTKREVVGRYRGSMLGLLWSLFNPLLMLAVYTFVFGTIFKAKWGASPDDSNVNFALILFAGMIVFSVFGECLNRSPSLILSNPNFVKKVVFPLEVMPVVLLLSSLFHFLVSLTVLVVMLFLIRGHVPWTAVFIPLVLLPLIALCLGASWVLSSIGVYVRDIHQAMGVVVTALMFLSPIFFPSSAVPEAFQILIKLNPLSFPIEQGRDVLLWSKTPDWIGLLVYTAVCMAIMQLGYLWFQRTRQWLADVM